MKAWVKEIWIKHAQAECRKLGFYDSKLSFDPFVAHLDDGVKNQGLEDNSDILAIAS